VRRLIALLSAAALLTGCSLDPAYRRPGAPVPQNFPQGPGYPPAPGPGPAAAPVASIGWRAFFVDANLRAVIEKALAQNRDLRVAVANLQAARAQYVIQRADLLPNVSASFGESYQRIPGAVEGIPGVGAVDSRAYSLQGGVSAWEIDLFGHTRSLTRAALEQYLASEDNRRSVQTSLIAEVATDYFTLAADRQLLAVAQRTLASQQASLDLTRGRLNAGVASMVDVEQAESTVQQARSDVAQFTTNAGQAQNALDLVVGAAVPEFLLPQGLAGTAGEVADLQPGAPSQVLLQRPDVLQAEHQLKAANADIGAARAAFFPTISLTAQAGQESTALSSLFSAASRSWLFQPNASLPLFAGGRNVGGLRYAKAQRDAAVAQYEKAIQTAFREVADCLARQGTIADQLAAQQALVDANAQSLALSNARYERGADTYLNVLVAERSLYGAQQSQISTQLMDLSNIVTLYRALGGGQG
jgi:multidrug efflux system outer membrane protein